MTEPLAADRYFVEAPIFRCLDATSFAFAFELAYKAPNRKKPERTAFRLRRVGAELTRMKEGSSEERAVFAKLVQPIRSFLDDVTMGPAGSNGRPGMFAASGARPNARSRSVWICRPPSWRYEFENEVTELAVPAAQQLHRFRLRDSFAVFESGRIFYLLTLTQSASADEATRRDESDEADPDLGVSPVEQNPIDEYLMLQLQQLALDPERCAVDADYLGFCRSAERPNEQTPRYSLLALAELRLRELEQRQPAGANGVADILKALDLVPNEHVRERIGPQSLQRLCIAVESDEMLSAADRVNRYFLSDEQGEERRLGWFADQPKPANPNDDWEELHRGGVEGSKQQSQAHDDVGNLFPRDFLAFAGIAQAVPDFPFQDESEVYDSTRPAVTSVESALYVHPRFVLEVAKSWRSFNASRPAVGTCPYLLLTFLVMLHDELVVGEMERVIDDLIYLPGALPKLGTRSLPMRDVQTILLNAMAIRGDQEAILRDNLRRRFDLFRWSSVHRSGNIFRYTKERNALEAVQKALATDMRFERAHATIDRMESIVEDVASLKSAYAARRTNLFLFVLAIVGVFGLPKTIKEFIELLGIAVPTSLVLGISIVMLLGVVSWFAWNYIRGRRSANL